jgi:3-oxoacyl-[acyl-carrier protein] reductase
MMRLKDKVALVTGGSRGIGRSISNALAHEGAVTIINYKDDDKAAEQVLTEINNNSGSAYIVKGDIRENKQVDQIVKNILDRFGRIDILVNNAGITKDSLLFEMEDADWRLVFDTNLGGVYNCTKAVIRPMMLQNRGRVINISSIIAERPGKGQSCYAASKGAINSFTKAMAVELAAKGITVNAIAPGWILTDMSRQIPERVQTTIRKLIPIKRIGHPEEIAPLVVFLASDDASYITGEVFNIDGGLV